MAIKKKVASAPDRRGPGGRWRFILFLFGDQWGSEVCLANVRAILEDHLDRDFELEVSDMKKDAALGREHQVLMLPTLIRISPEPQVRLVGTFTNRDAVVAALELPRPRPGPD